MNEPKVILVDENDNPLGTAGKTEAHEKALLHRAVSVFIINSKGKWILQKRSMDKYHSKGLWTNTCCTHPYPGESNSDASQRRLMEEMGITCTLIPLFSFIYREILDTGLTEYEYDHVFAGITDKEPVINKDEVDSWRAVSFEQIDKEILNSPENYTYWFREIYKRVNTEIIKQLTLK